MSAFVADSSVVAAWFIASQASAATDRLLDRAARSTVHVPAHWPFEFANILVQLERRRRLGASDALVIFRHLARLQVRVDSPSPQSEQIARVAQATGLSAYDAGFIELAQRRSLPLATRDAALAKAARQVGLDVL